MKKQILGLSILGVLALGSTVALASEDGVVGERGFARGGIFAGRGNCLVEGENRDNRLEEIAVALEGRGRDDLAGYLRDGEFQNVREALDGISQEDQLELREAMKESGLNNRAGDGCRAGSRRGKNRI